MFHRTFVKHLAFKHFQTLVEDLPCKGKRLSRFSINFCYATNVS